MYAITALLALGGGQGVIRSEIKGLTMCLTNVCVLILLTDWLFFSSDFRSEQQVK